MDCKRCRKCKKEKPLSDFAKNANEKDGKQTDCRQCFHEYHESRKADKEYQRGKELYYFLRNDQICCVWAVNAEEANRHIAAFKLQELEQVPNKD